MFGGNDDAKLMQGVKKRLKTIDNHALKFCKQDLIFSSLSPKSSFWSKKYQTRFWMCRKINAVSKL
jgi:hypothetical protein